MGFSEKHQAEGGLESKSKSKKWVIAGISVRSQLKPINTSFAATHKCKNIYMEKETHEEDNQSTTPTAKASRIPEKLACPTAPRKRRPASKCNFNHIEFFTPPDLETVFVRRVERAN